MVKAIESLDDIKEIVQQDCRDYLLTELVEEAVELSRACILYQFGQLLNGSKEENLVPTIEGRLHILYAELDRRAKKCESSDYFPAYKSGEKWL
jgi:hypothetical protein